MIRQVFWLFSLAVVFGLKFCYDNYPDLIWIPCILLIAVAVGIHDVFQTRHTILRNYPILGHFRYLLELIRPKCINTLLSLILLDVLFIVKIDLLFINVQNLL